MARSQSEMKKHVGMVGLVCRSPAAAPKTTPRARIAPAAPPLASAGIALNLCANWREMDAPSRARRGGPGRDIWAVAGGSSSVPRAASSALPGDRWPTASGAGSHLIYAIRTNIGRPARPYLFSAASAVIPLRLEPARSPSAPTPGRIVCQWQLLYSRQIKSCVLLKDFVFI